MLLATDLDGTLVLGEKEVISELFSLFKDYDISVVFVTGRDIKNFRKLSRLFYRQNKMKLVYPDYLVTLNGAKVYRRRKSYLVPLKKYWVDRSWFRQISKGWDRKACREAIIKTAEKLRFGDDYPSVVSVRYKPSRYYYECIIYYKMLDEIKTTLEQECKINNTKVNVIFDYIQKEYVDMGLAVLDSIDKKKAEYVRAMRDETGGVYVMMPSSSNKALAVDFIRKKMGLEKSEVIVAGDGGNDFHMLTCGFRSIVVNNAHPLLLRKNLDLLPEKQKNNLIFTKSDGAAGLLEGIKIILNQSFPHGSDGSLGSVINA